MNVNRRFILIMMVVLVTSAPSISQLVDGKPSDPLQELQKAFPDTQIRDHGKLLEFCPDETCDGFETSGNVPLPTLRDFAYLYAFFFSDNVTLDRWKRTKGAKEMADSVLGQMQYLACKKVDSREAARCVLRDISRNGKIRLLFVRYDEGERNVVRENLQKKLASGAGRSQ